MSSREPVKLDAQIESGNIFKRYKYLDKDTLGEGEEAYEGTH